MSLARTNSGLLDGHVAANPGHTPAHAIGFGAHKPRPPSIRLCTLQRASSAPPWTMSGKTVAITAQHITGPLEQVVDYSKAVLQADLAWVREQLEHERSKYNGAMHREQRRMMMELTQKSESVNHLQSQVHSLEKSFKKAQSTILQQSKDMAVLGRAQAFADWTSFSTTRKRLLSSMAQVDAVTTRASQAERALLQTQNEKLELQQQLALLKQQNEQLQRQCHLNSTSEMHGPIPEYVACA